MESKRIVLFGNDNLILSAVEKLLVTQDEWKMIRFSDEWSDDVLVQEAKRISPDVIVLHEGTLIEKLDLLSKFMQDFPKLRVITINLEKNSLEIYDKRTVSINQASDLLAIIADDVVFDIKGGANNPHEK